jgi:transposase
MMPHGPTPLLHALNAVFCVLGSGCPWRLPPREYPPWKTVYHYFRQWRINGTFEKLNAALRERLRICLGRNPQPSAGSAHYLSAKTTGETRMPIFCWRVGKMSAVIMRLPLSVVSITQNGARLDSVPPSRSVARAVVSEDAGPPQAVDLMVRGYQPRSTPRYS